MKAFHNDVKIKELYINRVKSHQISDEIVKGAYWENGKGCAVGCTLHSSEHKNYEIELGVPQLLAHLEDLIFENLPNDLAQTWPLRFLEAIKVGANLSGVWPNFAIFLLTDESQCNSRHAQCDIIASYYAEHLNGQVIDWSAAADAARSAAAWSAAAEAARSAAAEAARSAAAEVARSAADAAWSAAADAARSAAAAARSAAWSAATAARSAAWSAADVARSAAADVARSAADVARSAAFIKQSEKLLELLSTSEVIK
jgi:hypothetical protein